MKYTALGKSGIQISRITHGCMELGGGKWHVEEKGVNIRLLRTAYDNGITTFDTAEMYGTGASEEIVGEALEDIRKDCVIATKVIKEHLRPDDIEKAVAASLKRLRTDYVDLLYVHWPNDDIPIEDTIGKFRELKDRGVIRAIGVSNFSLDQLRAAMAVANIDALQPEFNLLTREAQFDGTMEYCAENQISVLSYNSVSKGILTGAFHFYGARLSSDDFRNAKPLFQPENLKRETPLLEKLLEISRKTGRSISQLAIAWVLAQRGMSSTIVGTQNEKHFLDNLAGADMTLGREELEVLDRISKEVISTLIMQEGASK